MILQILRQAFILYNFSGREIFGNKVGNCVNLPIKFFKQTNEPRKRKCILDYKMGVLKPALKDICARQAESLGTLLEKTGVRVSF